MPVDYNRRFFRGVTFLLLLSLAGWAALGLGAFYFYTHKSLPQTRGTTAAAGLTAPGAIVRDQWGIPHCSAETPNDLFYLAGYAQAQDRLFQMDLLRRTAAGRMAEWKGTAALGPDRQARTIGFAPRAAEWYRQLPPDGQAVLQAFAAGVNDYALSGRQALPAEYDALQARFEPWTPQDSLAVLLLSECAFAQEINPRPPSPPPEGDRLRSCRWSEKPVPAPGRELAANVPGFQHRTGSEPFFYHLRRSGLSLPSPHYLLALSGAGIETAGVALPGFPLVLAGRSGAGAFHAAPSLTPDALDPVGPLLGYYRTKVPPAGYWRITPVPTGPGGQPPAEVGPGSVFGVLDRPFHAPALSRLASALAPAIAAHRSDEAVNRAWIQVQDWDGAMTVDSVAALLYAETMRQALIMRHGGGSPSPAELEAGEDELNQLLVGPEIPGAFDDPGTAAVETRDDFLLTALRRAIVSLEGRFGPRMTRWRWGEAHRLKLRHPLGDEELGGVLDYFALARPSPEMPGGRDTLWNGYYNWGGDYAMTAGTSLLLVMDPGKPDELCVSYAGGQSGQPFSPHYLDLLQYWLAGECAPVPLDRKRVEAGSESVLKLTPGEGKGREEG